MTSSSSSSSSSSSLSSLQTSHTQQHPHHTQQHPQRDPHNNPLREDENRLSFIYSTLSTISIKVSPEDLDLSLSRVGKEQSGLLRNIMKILKLQTSDSIYRFWLTSCLESFVRGLGYSQQLFVSSNGILCHLVQQICEEYSTASASPVATAAGRMEPHSPHTSSSPTSAAPAATIGSGTGGAAATTTTNSQSAQSLLSTSTLQSSYDFLGEIIKFNFTIIEKFEEILLQKNLIHSFFHILSTHLIDSNVFLRALFVTFDSYHENYQRFQRNKSQHHQRLRQLNSPHSTSSPLRSHDTQHLNGEHTKSEDKENREVFEKEELSDCDYEDEKDEQQQLKKQKQQSAHAPAQCSQEEFKMMPNQYSYLPPSCPHRHVLYESLATGISSSAPPSSSSSEIFPDITVMDHPIASVGYLSHSWIHFQPEIISSEASFLLQQHQELLPATRQTKSSTTAAAIKAKSSSTISPKKEKKEKKIGSKPDSLLPISSLNINEAISSLRNIFRGSNSNAESGSRNQMELGQVQEMVQTEDSESSRSGSVLGYEELLALERERESRLKVCMDVLVSPAERKMATAEEESTPRESEDSEMSTGGEMMCVSSDESCGRGIFEWNLPSSVKHLSSYLEQQKEHILYGLMTIVTLRSINHENICCINTSLLIFIYAHKRYLLSSPLRSPLILFSHSLHFPPSLPSPPLVLETKSHSS
jgi:hypothetical protein